MVLFIPLPVPPKLLFWSIIRANKNHSKRVCHSHLYDEPVKISSTARCFPETLPPRERRCCQELIQRWWSYSNSEKVERAVQVIKGLLKSGVCSPVCLEYIALSVLALFRTCVPLPHLKDASEYHQFAP